MALTSKLFRGNVRLQACARDHAAHVTPGSQGEHVRKIQFALREIDQLAIDRNELLLQRYGPSTAAAVLSYKRKRSVINRSYQNTADDIVGIMTIASLDKEMLSRESANRPTGDCAQSSRAPPLPILPILPVKGSSPNAFAVAEGSAVEGKSAAPKQLGGVARIFLAKTTGSRNDTFPLSAELERARDSLFEHGISLSVEFSRGFADTLPFLERLDSNPDSGGFNLDELRKISEDTRPGHPGILRVIVCRMGHFRHGETFRRSAINSRVMPPFVLLNSEEIHPSGATLIHEMIHASKTDAEVPRTSHDAEPNSVFFDPLLAKIPSNADRTFLKPEHALSISRAFYTIGGQRR